MAMTPVATASIMIIVSGAAHAVVNAILKSGQDKMSSRALMDGFSAIIVLPFVFVVALPHGAWAWLGAAGIVHFVYLYCLIKAFESADMTVAYPIARGVAPALAATVDRGVRRADHLGDGGWDWSGIRRCDDGWARTRRDPQCLDLGGCDGDLYSALHSVGRAGGSGRAECAQLHRLDLPD